MAATLCIFLVVVTLLRTSLRLERSTITCSPFSWARFGSRAWFRMASVLAGSAHLDPRSVGPFCSAQWFSRPIFSVLQAASGVAPHLGRGGGWPLGWRYWC